MNRSAGAAWKSSYYDSVAAEISTFAKYFSRIVAWQPLAHDQEHIFSRLVGTKTTANSIESYQKSSTGPDLIFLNGHLNYSLDIQGMLEEIGARIRRDSRVAIVAYNPYLRWFYARAQKMGVLSGPLPSTFVTTTSLHSLARLAGFEVVKQRNVGMIPNPIFGRWLARILPSIPLLRHLCLSQVILLRPIQRVEKTSLSIVIPARNEEGNVPFFLSRLPDFGDDEIEVLIVEGHSTDATWAAVQKLVAENKSKIRVRAMQQTGKGKNDAVRLGFREASGDIVTILDADLTMPPEHLKRYLDAYKEGLADFVNGSRLVYPMEGEAMRFLNFLGNTFFSKALSFVLSLELSDTLCGTKLLSRSDYKRILAWREDFGDFDPFGDFELLFGASVLGLGTIDLPVYYRARTYGTTNISRFYHGMMLLKMCWIGFFRLRLGK